MYPIYKKHDITSRQSVHGQKVTIQDDCFAEKAKNWLWILGIIVIGVTVFVLIKFPGSQNVINSSAKQKNISQRPILIKELAMEINKLTDKRGVIIHSVYGGGRAQDAGLQVGDIIVRFNGRRVKNIKQFQSLVARARPESDVKIQVIRNGKKLKSIIMVGKGEMEGVTIPNQVHGTLAAWWCYRR